VGTHEPFRVVVKGYTRVLKESFQKDESCRLREDEKEC
jgi:hypothetical protein